MPYYFAYGSNMNVARVDARIGETRRALAGVLEGYRLSFDKASKVPGVAHANVHPAQGQRVEGALFELTHPDQITLMDPFEGHPHDYTRVRESVLTDEGPIEAWVYVAQPQRTAESLRPAQEYLAHLLAGKPFLSAQYHAELARVEAIESLDDDSLAALGLHRHTPR
ncbi:Uncharacterized conserved protein YtfP, gamma-glutamylcyclotransferase (GGCT)/AIG2-like family [Onishia taeanensis]|jgi:gamma-glutamylcyclotransferase (GGCT)/AIG2-like uncharacterized protein YtfP|uniref:Uncharacterized conserved protein YtfP, gamma-glutamylcyclotransferase (GGCT)/AIG2-like family n=1 Tax=Onishia taeanensis TaxID=284577 RepID=A0A1G7NBJ1_9GAMM|nr:gamma-glutamylcyclotransferase family protein [Halomonas taeanensis]SDF71465.1 Uncharacterized conserved protein YtfP, gamma-glutamylcyclotransferase (GGCT)/AIG2-like family [Halomonas taeanensis]